MDIGHLTQEKHWPTEYPIKHLFSVTLWQKALFLMLNCTAFEVITINIEVQVVIEVPIIFQQQPSKANCV